jgi:hypothetical protein
LGTTAYTISIGAGLTTDFAAAALPATRCRVPVTGTVLANNVSRTIHAIVDRNLLEGADNPSFDNPTTAGAPSGWTLNPVTTFAINGGPDGGAPNCSRSAWHIKAQNANVASRAEGSVPVNFTVAGGSTTTLTFHWRGIDRTGGGCAVGAASGPAWPAACAAAAGFDGQVCFRFIDGAGDWVANYRTDFANSLVVACPDPGTPSTFAACSASYQPGYPAKQTLAVAYGAGNRNVTAFFFNIRMQGGGRREFFIDHVEATNNSAVGAAYVKVWRDCSTAACP